VLEARGSASLGITTVTFTVNGQALPTGRNAAVHHPVHDAVAATTPALTITATARDGGGSVIGQDQVVVAVVVGLRFDPRLTGVAPGRDDARAARSHERAATRSGVDVSSVARCRREEHPAERLLHAHLRRAPPAR